MMNSSLDDKVAKDFLDQVFKLWINPELSRRLNNRAIPQGYAIQRALVRLPNDRPAIVDFNEGIQWLATVKLPPNTSIEKGDPVFVHQVERVSGVAPPEVDGKRVAFVYLFRQGSGYRILFDFSPNVPNDLQKDDPPWQFSEAIAESLQKVLIERTVSIDAKTQSLLQQNGFWPAPSLLPYPLSKIITQLNSDNISEAHETFRIHCNPQFIGELESKWWSVTQFAERKELLLDALKAHKESRFGLSIHTLLPHLEGIITDWISTKVPEREIPWRQESRTRKFRDLILEKPPTEFTYLRIVESAIEFILAGPVLASFKGWFVKINQAFPNRHVVEHGRYDKSLFTEENSIKLFLLLDTIYYIVTWK